MRTIHLMLHSRPELLEPVLLALTRCQDLGRFDELVMSVDPGHAKSERVREDAELFADVISTKGLVSCSVILHEKQLGPAGHHLASAKRAFGTLNADLNVFLEDDAVLMPDALRLAIWYEQVWPLVCPDAALLSFCNHRDFGKGQHPEIPDDPSIIAESPRITSPFAWACTRGQWPMVGKYWDFKQLPPNTWSFSTSMGMRLERKVALHPVLSRCRNIGRDGGVNEVPEIFDIVELGVAHSELPYHGQYDVKVRVAKEDLKLLDDWMLSEMDRINGVVA